MSNQASRPAGSSFLAGQALPSRNGSAARAQTRINGTFMSFDIKNAMMWQKMSPFPWTLQMKMVAYLFFVLLGSVPAFAQTGSKASSPMNPEESLPRRK